MTAREREHRVRLEQAIDNMEKTSTCLDIFDRALADAERGAYENAAKVCEAEALIDDERGYYGKEMAKAIRAKATE